MNECVAVVQYGIAHENAIGIMVFLGVVAVAYLARKIKDAERVTPGHKVVDNNGKRLR